MNDLAILANLQDRFPAPERVEVEDLERKLSLKLPEEYRDFLFLHNGGTFRGDIWCNVANPTGWVEGTRIRKVFGIGTNQDYGELSAEIEGLTEWLPPGYIPIADAWSDLIVLALSGPDCGKVFLWDGAEKMGPIGENLHLVANDFPNFLRKLREELDESEIIGKPVEFRWIWEGDIEAGESYLRKGGSPDARDGDGATMLMYAIAQYRLQIARILIKAGADINARTPDGRTPLHYAARAGSVDGTKLLLDAGAIYAPETAEGVLIMEAVGDRPRVRELLEWNKR